MTQATIVYGAKVERSTDGTTFEKIPEAKGISVPTTTTEYQDVTNLDSPNGYREYIKGLRDAGETTIPCNYTREGYAQAIADQNANGAITYRITMPLAPGQAIADTFTYSAFPTVELEGDDVGGVIGMSIALRITGDVTWTEGTDVARNPRGTVSFEAAGQTYALRLTTNAMVRYEDRAGESVVQALGKMEGNDVSISNIRRLFWSMLEGEHTEDDAGDLMDELGLSVAAEKIGEAARLAFPQATPSGNAAKPSKTATP